MSKEIKKPEEIEDEIKSLSTKRDKMIIEVEKIQNEIIELVEKYKALSGEYSQIECPTCGGIGYYEDKDTKKKTICKNPTLPFLSCGGKGFIWMKKFESKV